MSPASRRRSALVLTTLVLATTFTPIKRRLEALAEHRFGSHPGPAWSATDVTPFTPIDLAELDQRIEAIARRVSLEVAAERPGGEPRRGEGSVEATSDGRQGSR